MELKHVFALAAIMALVASMTGCTDNPFGGGGGGGGDAPGFEDTTTTVTFSDYAGDPEHGESSPEVVYTIPASSEPAKEEEEPEPESETGMQSATFHRTFNSSGAAAADGEDGGMELRIYYIKATLTWVDSDGEESDPDTFSLTVKCGEESKSGQDDGDSSTGGKVEIVLEINGSEDPDDYLGESATLTVNCIECGFTATTKPWGLIRIGQQDAGNDFKLDVEYKAWMR